MPISKAIFEVERSLNTPSTASWLRFIRLPPISPLLTFTVATSIRRQPHATARKRAPPLS